MVTRAAAATVQLPSVPRRHLRGDKPPNESILEEMDSPTSLQDEPSISSISASSSAMAFKDDTTAAAEAVAPDAVAPDADKRPRIEVGRMSDGKSSIHWKEMGMMIFFAVYEEKRKDG